MSTRAGPIPGEHVVGFDGPSDAIVLRHTVWNRDPFAEGALVAAEWPTATERPAGAWYELTDVLHTDAIGN